MKARFLSNDVNAWVSARAKTPRTPGLHVSAVVGAMLKKLKPSKYARWSNEAATDAEAAGKRALWELGYLWEDVLAQMLNERRSFDPDESPLPRIELGRDAIYGSPDQLVYVATSDRLVVEESKLTFSSCVKAEGDPAKPDPNTLLEHEDFRYWVWQAKTYAAMLHAHYRIGALVDHHNTMHAIWHPSNPLAFTGTTIDTPLIRIRAIFIRGDYAGRLVVPIAWELEPTAEELTTWWQTVTAFVRDFPDLIQKE